jgi:hypothetical protein
MLAGRKVAYRQILSRTLTPRPRECIDCAETTKLDAELLTPSVDIEEAAVGRCESVFPVVQPSWIGLSSNRGMKPDPLSHSLRIAELQALLPESSMFWSDWNDTSAARHVLRAKSSIIRHVDMFCLLPARTVVHCTRGNTSGLSGWRKSRASVSSSFWKRSSKV